jgi:hypothetical protein
VITHDPPSDLVEAVFPIAGELRGKGGKDLDAKWERMKHGTSNSDADKEGLRVVLNGGFKKENEKKTPQKAVIEFECDASKTGLENLPDPEDVYPEKRKRDEDDGTPSLTFKGYREEDEVGVLRLNWRTKYACESSKDEQDKEKGQQWGFFTWFIIVYVFYPLDSKSHILTRFTALSYRQQPTLYSVHGSITIDMVLEAGIFYLMAIRSGTFHTC